MAGNSMRDDHFKHMAVSFMIGSVASSPYQYKQSPLFLLGGVAVSLGFGLYKEWHDSTQQNNKWDWSDVGADLLGIGLAIGLQYLTGELWQN
jgi:uncharacterized protein YfiM (DUF2279 family)